MSLSVKMILAATFLFVTGCAATENDDPRNSLFEGTSFIQLQNPNNNSSLVSTGIFQFDLPDDADIAFVVLAVFADTAVSVVDGKVSPDPLGGLRTGQTGFSTSGIVRNTIRAYEASTQDFTGAVGSPAGTDFQRWAVWALDDQGNVVASSPVFRVDFN